MNTPSWTNRPRRENLANPWELLHHSSFAPYLRDLTIDDWYLSIADITRLYTLPKLTCLSLMSVDETKSMGIDIRELGSTQPYALKEFRIVFISPPTEAFASFIFQNHSQLERLAMEFDDSMGNYRPTRRVLADSMVRLLQPLRATLLELRLSMHPWLDIQPSNPLDFSRLQSLKILDVSGHIILQTLKPGDSIPIPLHERLPPSLESLIVSNPKHFQMNIYLYLYYCSR